MGKVKEEMEKESNFFMQDLAELDVLTFGGSIDYLFIGYNNSNLH